MKTNKSKMKRPKCSVCGAKARYDLRTCESCGKLFCLRHITFDADPFADEIGGDDTPVWECDPCRHESAMDI